MTETQQTFTEVRCVGAHDLYSKLVEFMAPRANHELGRCIFRGVRSTDFDLAPSALRGVTKPYGRHQRNRECGFLFEFLKACIHAGLALPHVPDALNEALAVPAKARSYVEHINPRVWPPSSLWQHLALAQHHGVSTRLLDWTYDPGIAMYFAACDFAWYVMAETKQQLKIDLSELARAEDRNEMWPGRNATICVWATTVSALHATDASAAVDLTLTAGESAGNADATAEAIPGTVEIVEVPRLISRNLKAQKGLFTIVRPPHVESPQTDGPTRVDEVIAGWSHHQHWTSSELPRTHMRMNKFVLAGKHVADVMRLLRQLEYIPATMLPSYEGAAKMRTWDKLAWNLGHPHAWWGDGDSIT